MSSISGFSTNSHLEEGAAEDASSKEDKQRSDPFASATSSTSTDPFAAFSVAGVGDPFTSAGTLTADCWLTSVGIDFSVMCFPQEVLLLESRQTYLLLIPLGLQIRLRCSACGVF